LVRLRRGRYECAQCGAALDIDPAAVPRIVLETSSGKPLARVLLVNGVEIHRCVVGEGHTSDGSSGRA
jgi:hypothetical protein